MASARSLLVLVPAVAAVPVIAASSQRRTASRLAQSLSGAAAVGRGPLQRRSRGLRDGGSASSSSGQAGRASLLALVVSSAANSAMAVSAKGPGSTAVVEEEQIGTQASFGSCLSKGHHFPASHMLMILGTATIDGAPSPDLLLTEFMVNMSCQGCVKSVRNKLKALQGVKSVDVDLQNQVVKILGSAPVRDLTSAIEQTGRDARLIGQGVPSEFAISAAVAEFKGPEINGVVRFAQVSMELVKIDASLSGLTPGLHAWSINSYGDLTRGAASTGGVYEAESGSKDKPIGDLGVLNVNDEGEIDYSGSKVGLQASELIGRAVVLYANEDIKNGITAAVIARSAGVGENYKKLCSCDGTVIWESSNNDFVKL